MQTGRKIWLRPGGGDAAAPHVPTVDVVIPCYNYGRYLEGCVKSVLSQRHVSVRVRIIDDGSTDDSLRCAEVLARSDGRVTVHAHQANAGHIATYNEGLLGWSTAEYVVLLSADDLLTPGALERATAIMQAQPEIGMVYGRPIYFSEVVPAVPQAPDVVRYITWSGGEWLEQRCRAGHNVISSPEVVVRGRIQRQVGPYSAELPHSGDLEMWLRIAAISNIAYVRNAPQAFYRVHSASMQRTSYKSLLSDLIQRSAAFESFFRARQSSLRDAPRLQEMAKAALASEALWAACRAYDRDEVQQSDAVLLVDFARKTYREVKELPEFAALRRRQMLGPSFCHRTQIFAASAALRWLMGRISFERWKRFGT